MKKNVVHNLKENSAENDVKVLLHEFCWGLAVTMIMMLHVPKEFAFIALADSSFILEADMKTYEIIRKWFKP